jgi:hypothetical protein
MAETWLRIVTYDLANCDEAELNRMKDITQQVLRDLAQQHGYQLGYWGYNPEESAMHAVTFWASRDAIDEAGEVLKWVHAERARAGVKVREVHNVRLYSTLHAPEPEETF